MNSLVKILLFVWTAEKLLDCYIVSRNRNNKDSSDEELFLSNCIGSQWCEKFACKRIKEGLNCFEVESLNSCDCSECPYCIKSKKQVFDKEISETATVSESPSETTTQSYTPTSSETPSFTPTTSETGSFTPTASETPSETPSLSETPSETPTVTETPSETPTVTETSTKTPTKSLSLNSITASETSSSTSAQTPPVSTSQTETSSSTSSSTITSSSTGSPTSTVSSSETPTSTSSSSTSASRTSSPTATSSNTKGLLVIDGSLTLPNLFYEEFTDTVQQSILQAIAALGNVFESQVRLILVSIIQKEGAAIQIDFQIIGITNVSSLTTVLSRLNDNTQMLNKINSQLVKNGATLVLTEVSVTAEIGYVSNTPTKTASTSNTCSNTPSNTPSISVSPVHRVDPATEEQRFYGILAATIVIFVIASFVIAKCHKRWMVRRKKNANNLLFSRRADTKDVLWGPVEKRPPTKLGNPAPVPNPTRTTNPTDLNKKTKTQKNSTNGKSFSSSGNDKQYKHVSRNKDIEARAIEMARMEKKRTAKDRTRR